MSDDRSQSSAGDSFEDDDEFPVPRSDRTRPAAAAQPPPVPPPRPASATASRPAPAADSERRRERSTADSWEASPSDGEQPRGDKELLKNDVRCVFLGPPQAGKTTVVGGILQSCMQPPTPKDEYRLKVIAGGQSTSDIIRETYTRMRSSKGTMLATQSVHRYSFSVRVTKRATGWLPETHKEAMLVVQDGPGGALFPDEAEAGGHDLKLQDWERQLLHEARAASCLVLCVDATQRDSGLLLSQLPGRLRDLSQSDHGTLVPVLTTWRQRAYDRFRRLWGSREQPQDVLERWISAPRVLILLTKVDDLAADYVRDSGQRVTPEALAMSIDPVRQACEVLGDVALHQILRALNPEAQRGSEWNRGGLAVGISSAWGFDHRTGRPFHGDGGDLGDAGGGGVRLNDWHPMGLRDALIFMVCGHARGTVRMVTEEALMRHRSAPQIAPGEDWFKRRSTPVRPEDET